MKSVLFDTFLLCLVVHQPAEVQAAEAHGLYQTANPASEAISSVSEDQSNAPYSSSSTWTGLVNLDKAGVHSIAGGNNSSEISEEHVVIHLQPEKNSQGWDGRGVSPLSQEAQKNTNTLGLTDLESLESHGGSAHEEEGGDDNGLVGSSDIAPLSSVAPFTSQPQTSNSMLAEFVNTLMRPFRYWTGGEEEEEGVTESPPSTSEGPSELKEPAGETQTQGVATRGNRSSTKAAGNKGSVDNTIMEHKSGVSSFRASTNGQQTAEEGLSEQEKEVLPLTRLITAVKGTGHRDATSQTGERAPSTSLSSTPSTVKGTSFPHPDCL